jgi:hypothetical protein
MQVIRLHQKLSGSYLFPPSHLARLALWWHVKFHIIMIDEMLLQIHPIDPHHLLSNLGPTPITSNDQVEFTRLALDLRVMDFLVILFVFVGLDGFASVLV